MTKLLIERIKRGSILHPLSLCNVMTSAPHSYCTEAFPLWSSSTFNDKTQLIFILDCLLLWLYHHWVFPLLSPLRTLSFNDCFLQDSNSLSFIQQPLIYLWIPTLTCSLTLLYKQLIMHCHLMSFKFPQLKSPFCLLNLLLLYILLLLMTLSF